MIRLLRSLLFPLITGATLCAAVTLFSHDAPSNVPMLRVVVLYLALERLIDGLTSKDF